MSADITGRGAAGGASGLADTGAADSAAPVSAEAGSYGIRPRGYRLPESTRVGRVRLQVADLGRSLAYYEHVLGLRASEHSASDATLAAQGDDTPLIELHELPGAAPVPQRGRLGLYHFAILLPERAALGRLYGHLAEIGARAGASDHLVSEALYLRDPDGLGIEVYSDRPRATWRRQGRELVMDTKALDAQDLMRAAKNQRWAAMPAGTVIGHVHLHVGDLARAAAFYHDRLGLDTVVWSYPGALFLSAGGYHHHLGLNTWAGAGATPPGAGDARLLDWELIVPDASDAEAAARSVESAEYEITRTERGWRTEDPWGTAFTVRAAASSV
jgi:catechol 2,3-dioxygenase